MSNQDLLEKLQFNNEKNILIQGLPSSIEKQFIKLTFSKNVTPLLKNKKIDFALLFAINLNQLCTILKEVFPALHQNSKLWVAYPKSSSKIVSDLNRACSWEVFTRNGFEESLDEVTLDTVWCAVNFKKNASAVDCCAEVADSIAAKAKSRARTFDKKLSIIPDELDALFAKHKDAKDFFSSLSSSNQKEFVTWIEGAKRSDTRQRRLTSTLEKLLAGKKSPAEK